MGCQLTAPANLSPASEAPLIDCSPLRFLVSGNETAVSPGRRFMIDLLVSSLMADGGLESALNAAIAAEIQVAVFCVCFSLQAWAYFGMDGVTVGLCSLSKLVHPH